MHAGHNASALLLVAALAAPASAQSGNDRLLLAADTLAERLRAARGGVAGGVDSGVTRRLGALRAAPGFAALETQHRELAWVRLAVSRSSVESTTVTVFRRNRVALRVTGALRARAVAPDERAGCVEAAPAARDSTISQRTAALVGRNVAAVCQALGAVAPRAADVPLFDATVVLGDGNAPAATLGGAARHAFDAPRPCQLTGAGDDPAFISARSADLIRGQFGDLCGAVGKLASTLAIGDSVTVTIAAAGGPRSAPDSVRVDSTVVVTREVALELAVLRYQEWRAAEGHMTPVVVFVPGGPTGVRHDTTWIVVHDTMRVAVLADAPVHAGLLATVDSHSGAGLLALVGVRRVVALVGARAAGGAGGGVLEAGVGLPVGVAGVVEYEPRPRQWAAGVFVSAPVWRYWTVGVGADTRGRFRLCAGIGVFARKRS